MTIPKQRLDEILLGRRIAKCLFNATNEDSAEFAQLLRSFDDSRNPLDDESAWLTSGALRWLEQTLTADMKVYEYGSGGSTLFFARRVKQVISVEHDATWHDLVRERLRAKGITNCDYSLHESVKGGAGGIYAPGNYTTTDVQHVANSFEEYVRSIEQQPDRSLDLVLVDGRSRASCLLAALPKVRSGGYLMLDNSEREEYQPAIRMIPHAYRIDFHGVGPYNPYMWTTSAFQIGT